MNTMECFAYLLIPFPVVGSFSEVSLAPISTILKKENEPEITGRAPVSLKSRIYFSSQTYIIITKRDRIYSDSDRFCKLSVNNFSTSE